MRNSFEFFIEISFIGWVLATDSITSDCLAIKNQVTLNENNTPYNFVPDTEQSCTNDFHNSYHQLQVIWNRPGFFIRIRFVGCIVNGGDFILRFGDNSTSWGNNWAGNCDVQQIFNEFYIKEQQINIYSTAFYPNNNISIYSGSIMFDFVKDCDCFSKNLTKIIHLNDSQSYAIKHGSVSQYCEPNSICEHARIFPDNIFNNPNLVMELLFKGCMPHDETRYLFLTENSFVENSQSIVASWNNSCDVYNRYHWSNPNIIHMYSLTNGKTEAPSDHIMEIDLWFIEGFKDIGLKSITQEYANQVRRRHWILCGVDTLSLILASYLIIKKSRKEMRAFKWFLLNIAIWSYLVDFNLNFLFIPLSLFPAPSICVLGIMGNNAIYSAFGQFVNFALNPYMLWFFTLGGCGAALSCAVYYRYRQLLNKSFVSINVKPWIIPMIFFHFLSGIPPIIPIAISLYNQKNMVDAIESLTSTYLYAWDASVMFECATLNLKSIYVTIFLVVVVLEILAYTVIVIGIEIYMLKKGMKIMKKTNKKIQDLHRQLIISIFLQSTIPLLCLILPYFFMIASVAFGLTHVIELIEWIFEFSALHSCLNTMAMIVSISSYRKAILDMFKLKKGTEVASVANVIHVKNLRKESIFILMRQKALTKPK